MAKKPPKTRDLTPAEKRDPRKIQNSDVKKTLSNNAARNARDEGAQGNHTIAKESMRIAVEHLRGKN